MYLRALAEASAGSSLKIDEVLHAERLSYYCVLLGIEQKEKGGAKLALDDGEIDFATSKRRRAEALPLQDGDVIPADVEDEDELEALDFDEVENILDAEQGLQSIEDEAADLDDHPVPSDDEDNDDGKDDDKQRRRQAPWRARPFSIEPHVGAVSFYHEA